MIADQFYRFSIKNFKHMWINRCFSDKEKRIEISQFNDHCTKHDYSVCCVSYVHVHHSVASWCGKNTVFFLLLCLLCMFMYQFLPSFAATTRGIGSEREKTVLHCAHHITVSHVVEYWSQDIDHCRWTPTEYIHMR